MFRKATPWEMNETPSLLQGSPPNVEFTLGEPVLFNMDFISMISPPDPPEGVTYEIPQDACMLVIHNVAPIMVQGTVADWERKLRVGKK